MSIRQRFVSSFVFPAQELLKGHDTRRVHREMDSAQWLSKEQLLTLQFRKLRAFLSRVTQDVPYWREYFSRQGLSIDDFTSVADLQRLPLQDKALIRANTEEMKSVSSKRLSSFSTGGSSGEPLTFFLDRERVTHDVAAKRRATRWWDVDIGDREIVVWGSPIELGAQDRIRLLRDRIMGTELLPAFEMSDENLDYFVERIRLRRPKMLFGYPSSLAAIAAHAERRSYALEELGIAVIFVTSERLYEEQRRQLVRVFDCPVANGYGGRDAGFLAHECPHGSMHITADDVILEIVDADGVSLPPGKSGEIVVTHLHSAGFPFIRYRTGDVGTLSESECSCGRGLPVLEKLDGRTTDFVVAQDGTVLHGLALIYVLREMPEVREFRIVQESLELTRVQVVPGDSFSDSSRERIVQEFRSRLGSAVIVDIEAVEVVSKENSGKFRYVQSKVKPPHTSSGNPA